MPPKFKPLGLQIALEEQKQEEQKANDLGDSLRMNQDGYTVLTNSLNPFNFSTEGMSKGGESIAIAERDIKIIKRLGAGASSTVFKGFLFRENKFVAVKKINVFEKDTRHQMLNDVKALLDRKTVPGLIQFFGAYCVPDSGQISIILEYMEGGSLQDVVQKAVRIPENVLGKLTAQILGGLVHLHKFKHMVHRDIKPANILVNLKGEAKITDFGISAFINSTLAQCNTFLGTMTYMSPERINNEKYSFPADIWSIGLVIVECATGKYPYNANGGPLDLMLQVLNEDLPLPQGPDYSNELRDFVFQCMQKDPLKRPTAEALLSHPFILKHQNDPVDLKAFMQCVFDPHDKLDEIAVVFAWNYYALLSKGADRLKDLAPLYSDNSTMIHNGDMARGRDAIIELLGAVAKMHAGFKVQHEVQQVDCQPLGVDGSALVHVQGTLQLPGMAGGGAKFTEAFILSQIAPGEYYVANQVQRLLT